MRRRTPEPVETAAISPRRTKESRRHCARLIWGKSLRFSLRRRIGDLGRRGRGRLWSGNAEEARFSPEMREGERKRKVEAELEEGADAFLSPMVGCGIVHLLSLLPDGWREWATMVADEYIVTAYPAYDLVGDFPRFLSAVFTRFVCYGSVPPLLTDSPVPEVQDPLAPVAPGYPKAGREAHEAARKGKAPIAVSEKDEEEGPPVAAPVGSSRLQALTVPSNFPHSHSTTETDHPDMGRLMVRVDAIWPHLREVGDDAAPRVPTEESLEDPHLRWDWACGEAENNPILVDTEEERVVKEGALAEQRL
ncbi:hypothetical protein SASPL_131603 [Salvia splendens]|uniref:Uncharacterized protein n=1 Tax=Salvia splendens TaxID=180675 RepID=A0A8X8ZKG0_SALSN|nr:hypothetical protein SASPL_131603 [Salvia splendens]